MDEATVIHVFPSCIHVEVRHLSSLLESREVDVALKSRATLWAKESGKALGSRVSQGWTLGTDYSFTRGIYTVR